MSEVLGSGAFNDSGETLFEFLRRSPRSTVSEVLGSGAFYDSGETLFEF